MREVAVPVPKERPILFSAPMVRALRAGTKTQTRRLVKPQPIRVDGGVPFGDGPAWAHAAPRTAMIPCAYGKRGDRLWVRETYFAFGRWETRFSVKKRRYEWHFIDMTLECGHEYAYAADGYSVAPHRRTSGVTPTWWKRPAIFMPRAASRITLEVTGVRVERLQNISEVDAVAEGLTFSALARRSESCMGIYELRMPDGKTHFDDNACTLYRKLWEQINGPGSWDANPWVWVVEFKRVTP